MDGCIQIKDYVQTHVGFWVLSFFSGHQGFLKSKDAERRLDQLKDELERGSQQIPAQQLSELADWLKEQQDEVGVFRTHCHNREKEMDALLADLNRLTLSTDVSCHVV